MKKRIAVDAIFVVGALVAIFTLSDLYISAANTTAQKAPDNHSCPFASAASCSDMATCNADMTATMMKRIKAQVKLTAKEADSVEKILTRSCAAINAQMALCDNTCDAASRKANMAEVKKIRAKADKELKERLGAQKFAKVQAVIAAVHKEGCSAAAMGGCGGGAMGGPGSCSHKDSKSSAPAKDKQGVHSTTQDSNNISA